MFIIFTASVLPTQFLFINFINLHLFRQSLAFEKIERNIQAVDSQPMSDGGMLIHVFGELKVASNNVTTFMIPFSLFDSFYYFSVIILHILV